MRVRRTIEALTAAGLLFAVAGCGGSQQKQSANPFAYDAGQPFGFEDHGRDKNQDPKYPIAVHDVSYKSGSDRIPAFLAVPPKSGKRRPAVIYLHGSGGDRSTLLALAVWLAGRGAVALAITAPSATPPTTSAGSPVADLRRDTRLEERDVIAIRRGIDLLRKRKDVDPNRIGFVGWSAGARTGAILAGIDHRLRTLVLMSGAAVPVQIYSNRAPKKLRAAVKRYLGEVDPLRYIKKAPGSELLLQDGRKDDVIPRSALVALAQAAPDGTTVRWYPASHALNNQAYRDQLDWLARKLDITGPPVKGATTGPS